ncbi:bromodomain associated protein [Grosmannia clavigera kw1407]|uniref:Bromodomain associated protein n=1 Tax=Grosmannia clavigera (strain kw1407 / UAMH 11150) TaxID=655863 RepID=F0XDA8_GROCL|nr:bromodomain associated protein [Grosmannia clavigera kw1407]EFX03940.1 bromodomain associated protein [Grosmannia clavigera kw1407]
MAPPPPLFHSLLRPCVLQILRAQGYYAARTSVVDSLTDMAARYLTALCEATARNAAHNSTELTGLVPTIVDVRMALEDCGALAPPSAFEGPDWPGDDTRSADEFIDWVCGPRNREIKRVALDGDDENTDYLSVLKKKHSKTGEDSKYSGTVLGRGNEHGDVVVEGGEFPSILSWQEKRIQERQRPPATPAPGEEGAEGEGGQGRSPSSGLSSVGDRSMEDMELEFSVPPS